MHISQINEYTGKSFQTKPLSTNSKDRLIRIISIVQHKYFGRPFWQTKKNKGSITLQSNKNPDQIVKVFIDYGNKLSEKCGIKININDPIVLGLEITNECAFVRESIRNELAKQFKYYIDPRQNDNSKWWLQPHRDHFYDIVFLGRGRCLEEECLDDDEFMYQIDKIFSSHEELLHLRVKDIEAKAIQTDKGFKVLKNSTFSNNVTKSLSSTNIEIRNQLIKNGIVKRNNNGLYFSRDHIFNSASQAASIIVGYNMNGPKVWQK